jgi:acyl-CoA hydrolase
MSYKKPSDSLTEMNELVLPNDTNTLGNLMGGRLLHWMDIVSAIAAQKHSNRIVVTVSVDFVSFTESIKLGDVVTLKAKVTRAFKTSMEIWIEVYAENIPEGNRKKCNEAFYTFVAVDGNNRPIPVNEIEPETEQEKILFDGALRRRQVRLIQAKRLSPTDAKELKEFLGF